MEHWAYERIRRRPTLPLSYPSSTIGAEELNFRVRNGNGCFLFAIATEKLSLGIHTAENVHSWRFRLLVMAKPHGLLVPVS